MHITNDNKTEELSYIKPLDGIRGLAILMVIFFHSPIPMFQFQFGWVGVNLFFILSGFLITRTLLNTKHQPIKVYLKNFYLRRILRIFPLYFFYLILAFTGLLLLNHFFSGRDEIINQGLSDFRRNYPYLVTYTYNFEGIINFLSGKDYHNSMFTGHLWSLSVEEQFYIIFPFLIYYLPLNLLKKLCLLLIVLTPFLRLLFVLLAKEKVNDLFWIGDILYVSTAFQLDTLSMGACLLLFDFKSILQKLHLYFAGVAIILITIGIVHLQAFENYGMNVQYSSLGYDNPVYHLLMVTPNWLFNNRYFYSIPLINFAFFLLMLLVMKGGILTKLFENKILVYLGKISYGIYIYHLGLSYLFKLFFENKIIINNIPLSTWVQIIAIAVYVILLSGYAWISYWYFEIQFLKKRSY